MSDDLTLPSPAPQGRPSSSQTSSKGWQPPSTEELQQLLPQYEITALLGRGGMGAVYKGTQKNLERPVAIKILPPGMDEDGSGSEFTERFKNEARSMARLSHPGIVKVFDFGETADGLFYIVMEFIEGTDVAQMLKQQERLPPEHAYAITAHVCDALAYAHDRGIIHRDIKPANIMVGHDGVVKVADFGLAKMEQAGTSGLTRSGMALGTLHYMAPEALMLGTAIDHRADLYAVGVMLYQMLTGRLPQGIFKMPSQIVPGLDDRYDGIVARAMREDRALRHQSAAELRAELDTLLTRPIAKVEAPSPAPAALPAQQERPYLPQAAPQAELQPQKSSSAPLAWLCVAALVAAGAYFWQMPRPASPQEAESTPGKAETTATVAPPPPVAQPPASDQIERPASSPPAPTPPQPAASARALSGDVFGFPQKQATVLCDTPELRLSICNDDTYLMVQAVLWADHEDREGTLSDGRKMGDRSNVYFRLVSQSQPTPQVDRTYVINPWPGYPGLNYDIVVSEQSRTTIKNDSQGRGSLEHIDTMNGSKARVDTFLIPLAELSKKPGETLWLNFSGRSPADNLNVTFPTGRSSEFKLSYTLVKDSTLRLDPQAVPDKRSSLPSSAVAKASPVPAIVPSPAPPPAVPVNAGPQAWTDAKGRQITASFVRLLADRLTLKMNGRDFELSLNTLAPASQQQARTLAQTQPAAVTPPAPKDDKDVLARYTFEGSDPPPGVTLENTTQKDGVLELNGVYLTRDGPPCKALLPAPGMDYNHFTVAARLRPERVGDPLLFGGTSRWLGVLWESTSSVRLIMNNYEVGETFRGARLLRNRWVTLAVTCDLPAREVTLYLDGKAEGVLKLPQDFKLQGSSNVWTTACYGTGKAFKGQLDELVVYGRVLSPVEIAALELGTDKTSLLPQGSLIAAPTPARTPTVPSNTPKSATTTINIGDVPPIQFTAVDGREVDLASLKGKVVLIDFWATWCGPCVAEIPNLVATYQKYHDQGFEIIGISLDSDKAALERMTKERGMTWPQYFDGKGWQNAFGTQFGIRAVPTLWLIGKDGKVASTNARADLAGQVASLLGVTPAATAPAMPAASSSPPSGPVTLPTRRQVVTPQLAAIPFPATADAAALGDYVLALLAYNPWQNNQSDKTGVQERLTRLQDAAERNFDLVLQTIVRAGTRIDTTCKDAIVTVARQQANEQNKAAIFKAFEKCTALAAVIAEKKWIQESASSMAVAVRDYPYLSSYSSHETGFFSVCFQSEDAAVWQELEALFSKTSFSVAHSVYTSGVRKMPADVQKRAEARLARLIPLMLGAARQADPSGASTGFRILYCSETAAGIGHADALQALALFLTTGSPQIRSENRESTQKRVATTVQTLTGSPATLTPAETGRWVLDRLTTLRWDAGRKQFLAP